MKKKLKTVIVDDHKIFGEGFCSLLETNNFRVKRVFQNSKKALNYVKEDNRIQLIFSDVNMPDINGVNFVKKIREFNDNIKIIMISMYTDKNIVQECLKNGANGYLSKNCSIDDILKSVNNALKNKKAINTNLEIDDNIHTSDSFVLKYKITDREKEIIRHIIDQKSNLEIAQELDISKRTVETHRKNIMLKLEVKNSIGIAVKCFENNILD